MKHLVRLYDRTALIASSRIAEGAALLLMRAALAGVFWRSGQTKLAASGFPAIDPIQYELFANEFSGLPLDPALAAPLTVWSEHLFPALLLVGLATRFSAAALLVMTLVIQIFVFPDAWWPAHSLWAAMAAMLIVRGGGLFALDTLFARLRRR